jgi:hypothetical protein
MHAFFVGALRYNFASFAESSGKAGSERQAPYWTEV